MFSREATRGLRRFNLTSLHYRSFANPKACLSLSAVRRVETFGANHQVATLSLVSNNTTNQKGNTNTNTLWIAASAAILSGSAIGTTFLSAKEEDDDNVPTTATTTTRATSAEDEDDKEEEDPYENLPEEDEPTDCSMCNTFRQGPCRPYWRKLERCFKDHEGQENGASHCMRYFMPHQQCLMNYTNLYNLVRLTSLQEYIDELRGRQRKEQQQQEQREREETNCVLQ